MSSSGLNYGTRRAYSELEFTGRKRPIDLNQKTKKKHQHRGENTKNHCEIAIS
jgi:hypothetical protein